jgi:photosystem II stability/assembly factor-like uncharacterized protein
VAWVARAKLWIAAGTSGSDVSSDGGRTWNQFDATPLNAISFSSSADGWAVGPGGRIVRWRP